MHTATSLPTWILVANAGRAILLSADPARKHKRWHVLRTLEHPESREMDRDLGTDRPGLSIEAGTARHSGMGHTSPKELEARRFAGELCEVLVTGLRTEPFGKLVVAASPHFLGLLRAAMPPALEAKVGASLDKDYTHLEPEALQAVLREVV